MRDEIEVEWLVDGGYVRNFGYREKGKKIKLPSGYAKSAIEKGWAKEVKPTKESKEEK